jgi:hypothetical protein
VFDTKVALQEKNKISLRNLSMVMRQLKGPLQERQQLIRDSVDRAKEAVQLDLDDGTSWCLYSVFIYNSYTLSTIPITLKTFWHFEIF